MIWNGGRISMSKVVAVELVSLDGVMESPSLASRSRAEGPSVG
jgi:hypothetical protein